MTGVRLLRGTLAAAGRGARRRGARRGRRRAGAALRVENALFGPHVTVTGLLGGAEVLDGLRRDRLPAASGSLAPRAFCPRTSAARSTTSREDQLAAACGGRLVVADALSEAFARLSG